MKISYHYTNNLISCTCNMTENTALYAPDYKEWQGKLTRNVHPSSLKINRIISPPPPYTYLSTPSGEIKSSPSHCNPAAWEITCKPTCMNFRSVGYKFWGSAELSKTPTWKSQKLHAMLFRCKRDPRRTGNKAETKPHTWRPFLAKAIGKARFVISRTLKTLSVSNHSVLSSECISPTFFRWG